MLFTLALAGCDFLSQVFGVAEEEPGGKTGIEVTFNGLTANGAANTATTELTLTFSAAVSGLSAEDIALDSGATDAVKGALGGSGPSYTLGVSGIAAEGEVSVSVSKSGYTIRGNPQTVTVYPMPVNLETRKAVAVSGLTTTSGYLNGIAYGGGVFVIGSNNGKLFRSEDRGNSWLDTGYTGFGSVKIYGVAYGGGVFVVGGDGGKMARSADNGGRWTPVTGSTFGDIGILRIRYLNGKFYAVGNNGKMAYSTDKGESWNSVDSGFGSSGIWDIAYGGGKYVATGEGPLMRHSADGITGWQTVGGLSGIFSSMIVTITYGGGKFVAGNNSANGNLGYSAGGDSGWVKGVSFGNAYVADIAWGTDAFIAICGWPSNTIAYSDNGVSWSFPSWTIDGNAVGGLGIAYGGGRFVIVADGKVFVIGD